MLNSQQIIFSNRNKSGVFAENVKLYADRRRARAASLPQASRGATSHSLLTTRHCLFHAEGVGDGGWPGQSVGAKSTPQKCGAGERNSTPMRWPFSDRSPRNTTRHSCSSSVAGLIRTRSAPISRDSFKYSRPPWALMTTVRLFSRNFRPWAFRPAARIGIRVNTRELRRLLSTCGEGTFAVCNEPGCQSMRLSTGLSVLQRAYSALAGAGRASVQWAFFLGKLMFTATHNSRSPIATPKER
jgi:hypothetical protein